MEELSRTHLAVNDKGHLSIGGLDTIELADEHGTPLYVTDSHRIRHKYRSLKCALSREYEDVIICYAYKANSNLSVCRILRDEGAGASVASAEGIYVALRVGVAPELIVFDGPSKSTHELSIAVREGIGMVNIESIEELHVIEKICAELGMKANVGVRVNLDLEAPTHGKLATAHSTHKFGMLEKDVLQVFHEAKASAHLDLIGIHLHAGSQILDRAFFAVAAERLLRFVGTIKERIGVELQYVNFGGGIGIPYSENEEPVLPVEYAHAICGTVNRVVEEIGLQRPRLVFEPGRFIVGDSTILLSRVNFVKRMGTKTWLLLDVGMNDFIRPTLYATYHHLVLANKMGRRSEEAYSVGGPVCESSDVFAEGVLLPRARRNDLVAIYDVGAYGLSMASNYNIRPIPAVVMVEDGKARVVRRRQTFEDLIACDVNI